MYQVYLKAYIYSAVPFIGGRRQVPEYCLLLIPSSSGGPFCLCLYNAILTSWPYSLEPGKETDSTESNQIISANTWNQDMRLHQVLLHPWMRPSNLKDWGWSTFTVWRKKKIEKVDVQKERSKDAEGRKVKEWVASEKESPRDTWFMRAFWSLVHVSWPHRLAQELADGWVQVKERKRIPSLR